MSNRRPLTVSQMVLALLSCKSDNDFTSLWNAYVDLFQHGFITNKQWLSFYNEAHDWYFDSDAGRVVSFNSDCDDLS